MRFKTNFAKLAMVLTTVGSIAACSHAPAVQEIPNTADPKAEIGKLENDINTALDRQVDVLAPTNFKQAKDLLKDANQSLNKQEDRKDILGYVAQSRAYLLQANNFAKVARNSIQDVINAREQALAAKADTLQRERFQEAERNLVAVTRDIENNDLDAATAQRSELQLSYLTLELNAIKSAKLGKPKATVAQAIKDGAQEFAPQSLAIAEKSILDTDAFITANRHDTAQIDEHAKATALSADHLLKITADAKSGNKTTPEAMALELEKSQLQVAAKQGQLRSKDIASKELNAQNTKLEAEQAFNKRFENARAQFSESEAEVYKQGDTLTIRLKSLEFPVAQAVLKGSNFPLLARVQKVIAEFGVSAVVVEGHTDSTGSKVANDKLSAERADAVKQYLASNADVSKTTITAIGYGFQKPLATNKTADGRAQNRRVDVLIKPDTSAKM